MKPTVLFIFFWVFSLLGCHQQNSLDQKNQSILKISSTIDILFVVDNSSSRLLSV